MDLKKVFNVFSGYEGSYIARKTDRLGKKFGFLSFRNVSDAKRLEGDMCDVWMGSYKLFVVLARFVDGERVQVEGDKSKGKAKEDAVQVNYSGGDIGVEKANPISGGASSSGGGNGKSYRDAIMNRRVEDLGDVIKIDDKVEVFSQWHGVSLIGRVKEFKILSTLNILLKEAKWSNVGIKYVGGFLVVLIFRSVEECISFAGSKEVWGEWFETLERWTGQWMPMERIAWLQVHGVPMNLACDPVFQIIGRRYGRVIQPACLKEEDKDFSYVYIGILCSRDFRIADRFSLSWRGVSY
ncbi:putative RNA-binding domain superfamily [Helianthus annuus]|nr:putative RNA-binding domain superfamily [Helianthus annuus]KAJ0936416.1 putative RNA-binding domain superfamily [Helianthus annuus]